jgi:CRISPR/Cas system-associated endonuclease Cas1
LGFLNGIIFGRPPLVCDFFELYRYLMDDLLIEYARNLKPKDFSLKDEDYSSTRKGKRQYLNDKMQKEFLKRLNAFFMTKVEIPRIMKGESQEIETLINEEAFLFAKYLRGERPSWTPRITELK